MSKPTWLEFHYYKSAVCLQSTILPIRIKPLKMKKNVSDFGEILLGHSFDPDDQKSAIKTYCALTLFNKSAVCL